MTGRYLRGVAQKGDRLMLVVDVGELLAIDAAPVNFSSAAAGDPM
jgi:hypothetical protein